MHFRVLAVQFPDLISALPSHGADNMSPWVASGGPSMGLSFCRAQAHLLQDHEAWVPEPCAKVSWQQLQRMYYVEALSPQSKSLLGWQTRENTGAILTNLGTSYFLIISISVVHHGTEGRFGK